MARIKVLGGTGHGGEAVVREAVRRGHEVTSYSRRPAADPVPGAAYVTGSLLDEAVLAETVRDADVVFDALSPRGDMQGKVEDLFARLLELAEPAGVRVGVLGGVSSMLVADGGPRLIDVRETPAEILPEVMTGITKLELLQKTPEALDWFYVSPAESFGAWIPQHVTGTYRTSEDVALTVEDGETEISAADLALAVLDEIEEPRHQRGRFQVAH